MKTTSFKRFLCALAFSSVLFSFNTEKKHTTPSFSEDVFPIIKAKCNLPTCHGVQKENPLLTGYNHIKPLSKRILIRIKNRSIPMPPRDSGIKLTKEEVDTLEAWINAGAPQN